MKIIEIKKLEDCFNGSYIKELYFDGPVTRDNIVSLKDKGELKYFPKFARPFFSFEIEDLLNVKGVEGNWSVRIWIKSEKAIEFFQKMIE
jgi:hypothetical protein